MKEQLSIIKIGGNIINNPTVLTEVLTDFSNINGLKILVHGGGRKASEVLKSMNIEPKMVNGRRITDEITLEVVTMVYAGLINKNVVAQLQTLNCMSIGLTGADLNSIQSHKRIVKEVDYGFAGDIDAVNSTAIQALLEANFSPVFCSITHNKKGQLLNTNADTIASALAVALSKNYQVSLKFCFEEDGVLLDFNDKKSVIQTLSSSYYEQLKKENKIFDGMIPKIDNAFDALNAGVQEIAICNTKALKNTVDGKRLTVDGTQLI